MSKLYRTAITIISRSSTIQLIVARRIGWWRGGGRRIGGGDIPYHVGVVVRPSLVVGSTTTIAAARWVAQGRIAQGWFSILVPIGVVRRRSILVRRRRWKIGIVRTTPIQPPRQAGSLQRWWFDAGVRRGRFGVRWYGVGSSGFLGGRGDILFRRRLGVWRTIVTRRRRRIRIAFARLGLGGL